MKRIIGISGLSGSGKDTIANYIRDTYGIKLICSATTRPMRDYETNGVEHIFLTDEEADKRLETEQILAYTYNEETGIRYFATEADLVDDIMIYIINPDGIRWFNENVKGIEMISIYVDLDIDIIYERLEKRGDNMEIAKKRLESELEEHLQFRDSKKWDYLVNTDKCMEYVFTEVDGIMCDILRKYAVLYSIKG